MRFSIVVPVYNASKTLSNTVDSILNQSFRDFELILVNDGSKDNSLVICQQYANSDSRIVVINKENGGVSSARNKGLEVAHGEYVCFVDSDDLLKPDWLEAYAVSTREDLICQGMELQSVQKTVSNAFESDCSFQGNELLEAARLMNEKHVLNPPWSKCYKREIIQRLGLRFWQGCHLYEDLIFTLQFLQHASSAKVIAKQGYIYRLFDSVLTRRFNPPAEYLSWTQRVVQELESFVKGDKSSAVYRDVVCSQFSLAAWFIIQYYARVDKSARFDFYRFLRQLVPFVDFSRLEANRRVFKYAGPSAFFDSLVATESQLYCLKNRFC
jgi:glycosyltransferase involved in cell wall biosynthesis